MIGDVLQISDRVPTVTAVSISGVRARTAQRGGARGFIVFVLEDWAVALPGLIGLHRLE